MIKGVFVRDTVPIIKVAVAWEHAVQTPYFILDTGFTGDLQVTPEIAQELGLSITGVTDVRIASGEVVTIPMASALASMEGLVRNIQVLIQEGFPLAGISLLSKFDYKATIDCCHMTVNLERVI